MATIPLNQTTINQYKDFLENPQKYACTYKPIKECFVPGKYVIPQHLLYQLYVAHIDKPLPKAVFYIIMQELYSEYRGNAPYDEKEQKGGEFGYKLDVVVPPADGIKFTPTFKTDIMRFEVRGYDKEHDMVLTTVKTFSSNYTFNSQIEREHWVNGVLNGDYKIMIV